MKWLTQHSWLSFLQYKHFGVHTLQIGCFRAMNSISEREEAFTAYLGGNRRLSRAPMLQRVITVS